MAINFIKKGNSEKITPIYATVDFSTIKLPIYDENEGETSSISYVYKLDNYYLILLASSSNVRFALYKFINGKFIYLGNPNMKGGFNGYLYPGIIGYDENYVYMYRSTNSNGKRTTGIYLFNLKDKTCSITYSGTSKTGNVIWSNNRIFHI